MRNISLVLIAVFLLSTDQAKAIEVDKIAHFSTSYVACDLLYKTMEFGHHQLGKKKKKEYRKLHIGHRIMVAALINVIGHVKETGDPYYDKKDILANALGSTLWLLKMQIRF